MTYISRADAIAAMNAVVHHLSGEIQYSDAVDAINALPAVGWQPIETAPKDGRFIIGYDPDIGAVCQVWWCGVFGRWESLHNDYSMKKCVDGVNFIFEATPSQWMPLPDAP